MNPVPGGTHLVDELVGSRELARATGFILNPRCRICRHDPLRTKVNGLLAFGASYAMILRSLEDANSELDKRDRVTIDSIRNHTARHFPVQHIARATYRDILERRAKENGVDFVKAVATAITPMAFYETVMAKGYETLVHPNTKVDINTGMIAAGRLQAMIDSRGGQTDLTNIIVQVDRVIKAVQSTVPQHMWGEIVEKLEQQEELPDEANHGASRRAERGGRVMLCRWSTRATVVGEMPPKWSAIPASERPAV